MKCEITIAQRQHEFLCSVWTPKCDFETLIFALARKKRKQSERKKIEIKVKWQKLKGRTCSGKYSRNMEKFSPISFSRNHHSAHHHHLHDVSILYCLRWCSTQVLFAKNNFYVPTFGDASILWEISTKTEFSFQIKVSKLKVGEEIPSSVVFRYQFRVVKHGWVLRLNWNQENVKKFHASSILLPFLEGSQLR